MLKINNSKKKTKKSLALILASFLFASSNIGTYSVYATDFQDDTMINETEFYNPNFSDVTNNILKEIANKTLNKNALSSIDIALSDRDKNTCEYFISQGISSFANEQKKIKYDYAYQKSEYSPYLYEEYTIEDIYIVNNLNRRYFDLPRQLCLLTKLSDFGGYSLFEVHGSEPTYIITDKDGRVLSFSTGYVYKDLSSKKKNMIPLKDFLTYNGLKSKNSYTYFELFEGLTFDVSKRLSFYGCSTDVSKVSDIRVVDANSPMTYKENTIQDYYFLKYECPYLFIEGKNIYADVCNPSAIVTIDEKEELYYHDPKTDTSLCDLMIPGKSISPLIDLAAFARDKNLNVGYYISDNRIKEISKQLETKGKTLEKTAN